MMKHTFKELPILFAPSMVVQIKLNRKFMTRRVLMYGAKGTVKVKFVINDTTSVINYPGRYNGAEIIPYTGWICNKQGNKYWEAIKCPYGAPGNILYVRETHFRFGRWERDGLTKTGKLKWRFVPHGSAESVRFLDQAKPDRISGGKDRGFGWYKRPGIFLPKIYSRIWLQVDTVSVERLHNITEHDACLEGADRWCNAPQGVRQFKKVLRTFRAGFLKIWIDINGADSWNKNPLVWVVRFKVVSTTGKHEYLKALSNSLN